jgi:DNA-binding transcriptional MerR regulator
VVHYAQEVVALQKYMTVSEIAKEANVSVRTLQYYDKAGLLPPAAHTEGGNRLYSDKELVRLFQIKGLKQLGLSLNEIQEKIVVLDEPAQVLEILQRQKVSIQENIANLQETISAIWVLEREIKNTGEVDFAEYAKLLSGAQGNWSNWWGISVMKPDLREHILEKYHHASPAKTIEFDRDMEAVMDAIVAARQNGISPESDEGKQLIAAFWDLVNVFIDGNTDLIPSLHEFAADIKHDTGEFATKFKQVAPFIAAQPMQYEGAKP